MAAFEQMRASVGKLLKGIDRYNPENLVTLQHYVETQAKENAYDLEANLAQEESPIRQILYLGELLENCHFQAFWQALDKNMKLLDGIIGFEDSVRKYNQLKSWMSKYGWVETEPGTIFICNQEENIKPKNIVEKIDFDSVSSIMASSQ
ncbi:Eukaryotic translation initiation factor 3 subunit K [Ophiophagus hannah]|uniref:Eukaryotic translation initiation factor 3 subunit K n=1 Tax=Ophiophagus hannah TaxID=8665 RepID=V8N548_OPHHA|nr:Eukaryotic translation initiation factor 3 subunit K [Ophiophagus hannah]